MPVPQRNRRRRSSGSSLVPTGNGGRTLVPVPEGYRALHLRRAKAVRYDRRLFGPTSYATWLWELEKSYLRDVLARYPNAVRRRYLDFACGTGRVISVVEPVVGTSTGVDVSAEMLRLADERVQASELV